MAQPTPLHEAARQLGASFVKEADWIVPAHFSDPAAEYRLAREGGVLFDRCPEGKVEVTGADASRFLHNLCTNDVVRLTIGTGCEAFFTTGQAKIVDFPLIFRFQLTSDRDAYWLDVGPGRSGPVIKHLDRFLVSEQVDMTDRTLEFGQVHLAGPKARTILDQVLGEPLPEMAELHFVDRTLHGSAIQVRRHQPLGLPGFDLVCPVDCVTTIWGALITAGARPAGQETWQILRLEAGTPVFGLDIDDTNLPQEIGRTEQAISFTKGCYIGQETVARIRTYGHVNRSLAGLKLEGEGAVTLGAKLVRDGKEVGLVTSSVVSPRFGAIALAYVRRGSQEPGTLLEIEAGEQRRPAEVTTLPFGEAGGTKT